MHGIGFEIAVHQWFETKMPRTKVQADFIINCLSNEDFVFDAANSKVLWLGGKPTIQFFEKTKKNQTNKRAELTFYTNDQEHTIQLSDSEGIWITSLLEILRDSDRKTMTFKEVEEHYYTLNTEDFEPFWYGKALAPLKEIGLLVV